MAFAHLHVHTEYSLLDGACRIERLLDTAKALGQQAVAITDHGCMYGVVDFYKAAKKRGIQPILGCEVYVARRTRFDKVHELDGESRHLVLLCENEEGYHNLIALVSKAWVEGFYNKPRVDLELLRQHHQGLIALSACLAGEIPRALSRGDYPGAKEAALQYRGIFGPKSSASPGRRASPWCAPTTAITSPGRTARCTRCCCASRQAAPWRTRTPWSSAPTSST